MGDEAELSIYMLETVLMCCLLFINSSYLFKIDKLNHENYFSVQQGESAEVI